MIKKIRKLTTGQAEDYTTGCLLDYGSFKNQHRLIAVDLSRQQKFNNNGNNTDVDDQSLFILKIL